MSILRTIIYSIENIITPIRNAMYSPIWHFTDKSWLMMIAFCGGACVCTYIAYKCFSDLGLFASFALALMSPLLMDMYFYHAPDPFWFCDFYKINWVIAFIGIIVAYTVLYVIFSVSIGLMKNLRFLFSDPLWSVLIFILGIVWFFAAVNGVKSLFHHHEFLGLLLIMGVVPACKTPTIYVEGKGHITGRGYDGGNKFHGDDGNDYTYDGNKWS